MDIQNFEFTGEGMHRVYENEKWCVGIKNWKPCMLLSAAISHRQSFQILVYRPHSS